LNWKIYIVISLPDATKIEIVLVTGPEIPAPVGEPSSAPIAAAIANAIFDATGVRLREAPYTPARILLELKKA
jgi:nicotinate dehydrogenase subunit B